MSGCARRRWGSAIPYTRPGDTLKTKEMDQKLQDMLAERTKQDAKWQAPEDSGPVKNTPTK